MAKREPTAFPLIGILKRRLKFHIMIVHPPLHPFNTLIELKVLWLLRKGIPTIACHMLPSHLVRRRHTLLRLHDLERCLSLLDPTLSSLTIRSRTVFDLLVGRPVLVRISLLVRPRKRLVETSLQMLDTRLPRPVPPPASTNKSSTHHGHTRPPDTPSNQ